MHVVSPFVTYNVKFKVGVNVMRVLDERQRMETRKRLSARIMVAWSIMGRCEIQWDDMLCLLCGLRWK